MTTVTPRTGKDFEAFRQWVQSVGDNCLVVFADGRQWYARIDKRGWFAPQDIAVPSDVKITRRIVQAYRGL